MATREKVVIVFSLAAFFLGVFYIFGGTISAFWFSNEANSELAAFFETVKIGAPFKDVEDAFKKGSYKHLAWRNENEVTVITTPLKWGAGNWIAIFQIKDEKVIQKKIRTEDSPKFLPEGAPKDEP